MQQPEKRLETALKLPFLNLAETVSRIFTLRDPFIAEHQQTTATLARAVEEDGACRRKAGGSLHQKPTP